MRVVYRGANVDGLLKPQSFETIGTQLLVRAVCGQCNNGWMSRLEAETKPVLGQLIVGKKAWLTEDDQHIIARWSVKTAAVLQRHAMGIELLTASECGSISSGKIPLHCQVRLAYRPNGCDIPLQILTAGVGARPLNGPVGCEISEPNAFVYTIAIGHVVLQTWGGPAMANPDRFITGGRFPLTVFPPTISGIEWPPVNPHVNSPGELEAFHEGVFAVIVNSDFVRPRTHRLLGPGD